MVIIIFCFFPEGSFGVELIVNVNNPVKTISLDDLRFIFLMRSQEWPKSKKNIDVYVNDWHSQIHKEFCKKILKIIPHRINSAWERRKYSGMGSIPTTVSKNEMLNKVSKDKGAIGYVEKIPNNYKNKVRILKVVN